MARKWQLPTALVDAIQYHHAVRPNADDQHLLIVIHAADIIVNAYAKDSKDNLELSGIHPDVLTIMESQFDIISDWYPDVLMEIESACKFFLEGQ